MGLNLHGEFSRRRERFIRAQRAGFAVHFRRSIANWMEARAHGRLRANIAEDTKAAADLRRKLFQTCEESGGKQNAAECICLEIVFIQQMHTWMQMFARPRRKCCTRGCLLWGKRDARCVPLIVIVHYATRCPYNWTLLCRRRFLWQWSRMQLRGMMLIAVLSRNVKPAAWFTC